MIARVSLAAMAAMVGLTAQAEQAAAPEGRFAAAGMREICTEIAWGHDGVRTDCRFEIVAAREPNPALKGICTTFYGRRTCY